MMKYRRVLLILLLSLLLATPTRGGYLQDFLDQWDESSYELHSYQTFEEGDTLYQLNLISLSWQEIIWEHRLFVIKPRRVQEKSPILLYISGSGSGEEEIRISRHLAHSLQVPVAILMDIPNQPLFEGLWEDDLLAYTLQKTLESEDYSYPLLFPMTKAAIKAMDALTAFSKENLDLRDVEFIVSGGSKRGWTTYLTAAKDPRVKALIPVSYDNLNLPLQMEHQLEVFGDYSMSIWEYTQRGIQESLATKEGMRLAEAIDPYTYVEEMTEPKLLIIGTNDDYWPLSALDLYYHDLRGDTYLLYLPNTGHGAGDWSRVLPTMQAFILSSIWEVHLPQLKKERTSQGFQVRIENSIPAREIRLWRAQSSSRDFREASWEMVDSKRGTIEALFSIEESREWQAFMAEGVFDILGQTFYLSTPVTILLKE